MVNKDGTPKLDDNGNQMFAERDSTSWDTQSYLYYMAHSVFNHIDAVQEANRLADVESYREAVDYTQWRKPTKKSSKAGEVSPYVPVNILLFQKFAEDVLDPQNANAREMISKYNDFLTHLSMGGEDEGTKENVLDEFFDF